VCCAPLLLAACGCAKTDRAVPATPPSPTVHVIQGLNIDATGPIIDELALKLNAARNETTSTVIQLANLPKPRDKSVLTLRIQDLQLQTENAQIGVGQFKAYQLLSMPVDVNRAGYVRHTGLKASSRTMPRALLPVPMDGAGRINVTGLRDPSEPLKPNSRVGLSDEPVLLWFDLQIPPTARPGLYKTDVEILRDGVRIEAVPLTVNVYDFVLPDERHLQMVGRIEWESLETLYPDIFPNITPHLMSRGVPKYEPAIRLLDQLVKLAQEHRTNAVVPKLQPSVKWPANAPPTVDWTDFDSIVAPWLTGDAFADHVPVGYWPLPVTEFLDRYPVRQQQQYWMAAVSHFDQQGWAERAWVEVEPEGSRRARADEAVRLSARAADILAAHPQLRVSLPLEDPQLQFLSASNKNLLNKVDTTRLMTAERGLVFARVPPEQTWPQGLARPAHWLRTDLPGLVPYIGAGGDERDVRLWAWLAFIRPNCKVIGWDGALPHSSTPQEAADPNELTWFYPGRWFGVDEPLPTIQLKWLRRAQQDYEYLYLARERRQIGNALVMARLMTKQVQTQPNEEPDPTHGLLSGTADPKAWSTAMDLVARNILLREPGKERDEQAERALNLETSHWVAPLDKSFLIARNGEWGPSARPGNWVDLRLGLDVYNASDSMLDSAELEWVGAPRAWEFNPQPMAVGVANPVAVFQAKQFKLDARVDLDRVTAESRKPITLKFTNTMKRGTPSYLSVMMPVAVCDRREGRLQIDGVLGDWDDAADAIHLGPLVTMLDRPGLQKQAMQMASTPSSVYANWVNKNFYVAFKLDGVNTADTRAGKNVVDYQLRRAWGEDLCEILIQPIYGQADLGQIVHLVCKPKGQMVISIKNSPKNQKLMGNHWVVAQGAPVQYVYTTEGSLWRGELSLPWDLINDNNHKGMRPELMRFNFVQHKGSTGESASWAGPVDYGQDDSFMGLLYLRDMKTPGIAPRENE
jgi:hypothetical protein